jgi:hypothetical protein
MTMNSVNTPNTVSHATWEDVISDMRILSELDELNARRGTEGIPESWIAPFSINPVDNAPLTVVAKHDAGERRASDIARTDDMIAPQPMKPIDFTRLFILDRCSFPGSPLSTPGPSTLSFEDTSSPTSDESIYERFSLFGSPLLPPSTLTHSTTSSDADTNKSAESFVG